MKEAASMIERLRGRDDGQGGFTLIELLVVIIIIGILAAIAVPVFLRQRQKGYQATDRSDLRNLANFEELYLNDNELYGSGSDINTPTSQVHPSAGVTLKVVSYQDVKGYCLSASHSGDALTMYYDSNAGGIQPVSATGCPTTYSTNDGVPIP
jgi:type IV pilus assembly protein PilA